MKRFKDNIPKLKTVNNTAWNDHRSGWRFVMSLLEHYQHDDGILLDGCIDQTFGYGAKKNSFSYAEKWIGFLHHPMNICPWYFQENLSPKFVLHSEPFKRSLSNCRGIFTLSRHLADIVRENVYGQVPIHSILHPTEIPDGKFDFDSFLEERKVVQIGAWLRRLTTFFKLKCNTVKKYLPVNSITQRYLNAELSFLKNLSVDDTASVVIVQHLSNENYDKLLAESVVFLDLFDSSANNAIIECIARNTPIIVNPLPSVVEYLGEAYPLYYNSLEEAEAYLIDDDKILSAHNYLKRTLDKTFLNGGAFVDSLWCSIPCD